MGVIPLTVEFCQGVLWALANHSDNRFAKEAFRFAAHRLPFGDMHFAEQALGLMGVHIRELPLVWEDLEAT